MQYGDPTNLNQAIEFFFNMLTPLGKETIVSEEPANAVNYIRESLRELSWVSDKQPFGRFIQNEFGLSDYDDVAYLISQGIIAQLTDKHYNPYDFAAECRNLWLSRGLDPKDGKRLITIFDSIS